MIEQRLPLAIVYCAFFWHAVMQYHVSQSSSRSPVETNSRLPHKTNEREYIESAEDRDDPFQNARYSQMMCPKTHRERSANANLDYNDCTADDTTAAVSSHPLIR